MFKLNLDISSKSSFISRIRTFSIRAEFEADAGGESLAVASVFTELVSSLEFLNRAPLHELDSNEGQVSIADVRGRPAESFEDGTKLANPLNGNRQEELLFLKGQVLVPPEEEKKSIADETAKLPFSARLNSEFLTFRSSAHIEHKLFAYTSDVTKPLPLSLLFTKAEWVLPIEIEMARIGFERFRAQHFSSLMGLMPRIVERSYLTLQASSAQLFFEIELDRSRNPEKILSNSFLKKFDEVLTNNRVHHSFLSELNQQLS